MPFKLKEGAKTEGLPTVTLGGEQYFVPRLMLGDRIEVDLAMRKLRPYLKSVLPELEAIAKAVQAGETPPQVTREFDADNFRAMIEVVSIGLRPLYPDATPEALRAEDIEFEELLGAWPVVVQQGASRRSRAGEAQGTSRSTSDTGIGSSSSSD